MKNQEPPPPRRRHTDEQCLQWWSNVQMQLASIAATAWEYLPDESDDNSAVLDPGAVASIDERMLNARVAADTAAGAYGRHLRTAYERQQRDAMAAGVPSVPGPGVHHGPSR